VSSIILFVKASIKITFLQSLPPSIWHRPLRTVSLKWFRQWFRL
jgi:hypothetical protein